MPEPGVTTMGPLYGVDGNLLVEDIVFPRYLVEDILDDRFKPQFAMEACSSG